MKLESKILILFLLIQLANSANLRDNQGKLSNYLQSFLQQEENEEETIYYTPVVLLNDNYQPLDNQTGEQVDQSLLNEQILNSIEQILDQGSSSNEMIDNFDSLLFSSILETIQEYISEDIQLENDTNSIATLSSDQYDPNNQNFFGLTDTDDTQLIRTNNGIYEVRLIQDQDGALQVDIDEELANLREQVNNFTEDLDDNQGGVDSISNLHQNYDLDENTVNDIDEISMQIYRSLRQYYQSNQEPQTNLNQGVTTQEASLQQRNPIYFNFHRDDADEDS